LVRTGTLQYFLCLQDMLYEFEENVLLLIFLLLDPIYHNIHIVFPLYARLLFFLHFQNIKYLFAALVSLFFQIEDGNSTSVFLQFASVPLKIHLLTVLFGVVFSGIEMALLQTIALNIVHNLIHKQLIYGNLSLLSFEPFRFHLLASFRYLKKSNPIRF